MCIVPFSDLFFLNDVGINCPKNHTVQEKAFTDPIFTKIQKMGVTELYYG